LVGKPATPSQGMIGVHDSVLLKVIAPALQDQEGIRSALVRPTMSGRLPVNGPERASIARSALATATSALVVTL
jgi:hypothetical protein